MITPRDVLEHYVSRHNAGVATGDFAPLLEMFRDDARLELDGVGLGPFAGKAEIARAFRERAPSDQLLILSATEVGADAIEASYGWRARPGARAGTLRLELRGGSIARLVVGVA